MREHLKEIISVFFMCLVIAIVMKITIMHNESLSSYNNKQQIDLVDSKTNEKLVVVELLDMDQLEKCINELDQWQQSKCQVMVSKSQIIIIYPVKTSTNKK